MSICYRHWLCTMLYIHLTLTLIYRSIIIINSFTFIIDKISNLYLTLRLILPFCLFLYFILKFVIILIVLVLNILLLLIKIIIMVINIIILMLMLILMFNIILIMIYIIINMIVIMINDILLL